MDSRKLRARVERLTDLLAAPDVVAQVREVADREQHSADQLADAIMADPALAVRVLRVVNSGFFNFPQPIRPSRIRWSCSAPMSSKRWYLTAPVFDLFSRVKGLWLHSLAVARASGALAEALGYRDPEELSLAGLLHDVGKPCSPMKRRWQSAGAVIGAAAQDADQRGRAAGPRIHACRCRRVAAAAMERAGQNHGTRWRPSPAGVGPRVRGPRRHRARGRRARARQGDRRPRDQLLPAIEAEAWDALRLTMDHAATAFDALDALIDELAAGPKEPVWTERRVS